MSTRKDLPAPSAPNFNQRLRETIQTYLGKQGDPLDRGLTLRDLIANGIVKFKDGFNAGSLAGGGALPIAPVVADNKPDLTPPPQPTGFVVSSAISHVFIEHDDPVYPQGHGHLRTHVYGAIVEAGDPLPTFADAVEVGQFSGQVWAMPSNPATTWRLWIKWESVDGVLSATPAGGTNGLEAVTGQDVGQLLEALQGQITESQLYADLGARIDLIDGSGPGSVSQKVAAESVARALEIQELANTTAQDLLNEAAARTSADEALQTQINTLSAASSGEFQDLIAALQEEQTTRIAGDTAETTARQTLAAQMRGGYNGTDITEVTTGLLFSERQARAAQDNAIAQDVSALSATVQTNKTNAEAAIQAESTTRANADGALSTQITNLDAAYKNADASLQASISTVETARANGDAALANQIATLSSTVNGNTAAIQTEAQTRATQTGDLFAKYTVKVDVNGYVSGFGFASTANNGATVSDFAIRADKFYIASPSGPGVAPSMPFIVRTTATTIGGVNVPVGVYINDAFIQNGTITNAKIGTAAIDDSKIANLSAGKITTGTLSADRIGANSITASKIDSRGLTIRTADGTVILSSGNGGIQQRVALSPLISYDFNGYRNGFTSVNATDTLYINGLGHTGAGSDPQFLSPEFGSILNNGINGYAGSSALIVRVVLERAAGTGWDGTCYYSTSAHGFSDTYKATVTADPTAGPLYNPVVVDFDFSSVSDYFDSYITQLRFDFGVSSADSFLIKSVQVGAYGDGFRRLTAGNVSTFMAAAVIGTAQIRDLAVQTLKIDNEAVTLPRATSSGVVEYYTGTDTPFLSHTWTSTGQPTTVIITFVIGHLLTSYTEVSSIKGYINGVQFMTTSAIPAPWYLDAQSRRPFTYAFQIGSPPIGAATISLTVTTRSGEYTVFFLRSVVTIENKR